VYWLIALEPIRGAHFNPILSAVNAWFALPASAAIRYPKSSPSPICDLLPVDDGNLIQPSSLFNFKNLT